VYLFLLQFVPQMLFNTRPKNKCTHKPTSFPLFKPFFPFLAPARFPPIESPLILSSHPPQRWIDVHPCLKASRCAPPLPPQRHGFLSKPHYPYCFVASIRKPISRLFFQFFEILPRPRTFPPCPCLPHIFPPGNVGKNNDGFLPCCMETSLLFSTQETYLRGFSLPGISFPPALITRASRFRTSSFRTSESVFFGPHYYSQSLLSCPACPPWRPYIIDKPSSDTSAVPTLYSFSTFSLKVSLAPLA